MANGTFSHLNHRPACRDHKWHYRYWLINHARPSVGLFLWAKRSCADNGGSFRHANISRILAWWREVDWRAVAAYAVTGVSPAVLGARTMLVLPPGAVDAAIGSFLLLLIPGRRWLAANLIHLRLPHLAAAGTCIGFLTEIVSSSGLASVLIGYGLTTLSAPKLQLRSRSTLPKHSPFKDREHFLLFLY